MAATSILVSHFSVGNAYYFSNMIASFLKKSSWPQPHLAILLSLFSCLSCLHCTSFEPNVYQKQPHRFQIPLVKLFGMCYYCRLASSVITILFIPAEHQTECSFFSMLNQEMPSDILEVKFLYSQIFLKQHCFLNVIAKCCI